MSAPKIGKEIRKLVKNVHHAWVYECLGRDVPFDSEHFMNLFAIAIVDKCLDLHKQYENEKVGDVDFYEIYGKHFGFIK